MKIAKRPVERNTDSEKSPNTDRIARIIAQQYALTLPHAREVARLAGLGEQEAQR
jgi:hypothetical protein